MARYRYTLKAYYPDTDQEYTIKFHEKEKVYLTTIDKFMLAHVTNENKLENFENKEELIKYLNDYYGYSIPLSSYVYISYQVDQEEKILEVVYQNNYVLQYFSYLYTYFYQKTDSEKKVKELLTKDVVWKQFLLEFETNIKNKSYYDFLIHGDGKKYVNSYLRKWIQSYVENCYHETHDEQTLFLEAKSKLVQQLQYYKVLRGIELSYQTYNRLYQSNLGLSKEKMRLQTEKQRLSMPIVEDYFYGKNYTGLKQSISTGYEELDELLGASATNISELSEQVFEELGLTLDDLEQYPDLQKKLGFPTDSFEEEKIYKR